MNKKEQKAAHEYLIEKGYKYNPVYESYSKLDHELFKCIDHTKTYYYVYKNKKSNSDKPLYFYKEFVNYMVEK